MTPTPNKPNLTLGHIGQLTTTNDQSVATGNTSFRGVAWSLYEKKLARIAELEKQLAELEAYKADAADRFKAVVEQRDAAMKEAGELRDHLRSVLTDLYAVTEFIELDALKGEPTEGLNRKSAPAPSPSPSDEIPSSIPKIAAMAQAIPEAAISGTPADGAAQHDHYLYGTPKTSPSDALRKALELAPKVAYDAYADAQSNGADSNAASDAAFDALRKHVKDALSSTPTQVSSPSGDVMEKVKKALEVARYWMGNEPLTKENRDRLARHTKIVDEALQLLTTDSAKNTLKHDEREIVHAAIGYIGALSAGEESYAITRLKEAVVKYQKNRPSWGKPGADGTVEHVRDSAMNELVAQAQEVGMGYGGYAGEMVALNFNDEVTVEPTPRGWAAWDKYCANFLSRHKQGKGQKSLTLLLWECAAAFGPFMSMGDDPPIGMSFTLRRRASSPIESSPPVPTSTKPEETPDAPKMWEWKCESCGAKTYFEETTDQKIAEAERRVIEDVKALTLEPQMIRKCNCPSCQTYLRLIESRDALLALTGENGGGK